MQPANEISVVQGGSLPEALAALLAGLPQEQRQAAYSLDQLALRLGRRLPEQAQTLTYWQRGALGRALRAAGFTARVEYGRIIFVRHC